MSKKRVGLCPVGNNFRIDKQKVIITEKKENLFFYEVNGAKGIIPFDRFLSREERSKVKVDSVVTIYRYFNTSGKRLLAYHARYES